MTYAYHMFSVCCVCAGYLLWCYSECHTCHINSLYFKRQLVRWDEREVLCMWCRKRQVISCVFMEVQWCQWHLHNLFMRPMMESQLSSTPISQVTKEEHWGEVSENDNEDENGERKQQRKVRETKWIKEDGETGVLQRVTRDVLNRKGQTGKRTRYKQWDERNWET